MRAIYHGPSSPLTGGFTYCAFGRPYGLVVTPEKHVTISALIDAGQPWRRSPQARSYTLLNVNLRNKPCSHQPRNPGIGLTFPSTHQQQPILYPVHDTLGSKSRPHQPGIHEKALTFPAVTRSYSVSPQHITSIHQPNLILYPVHSSYNWQNSFTHASPASPDWDLTSPSIH